MTDRRTIVPFFARPPDTYSRTYFDDMVRRFAQYVTAMQNPGQGRNTTIVLTDLTDNDVGLEAGTLYKVGTVIHVSVLNVAAVSGGEMTLSSGSVTTTP